MEENYNKNQFNLVSILGLFGAILTGFLGIILGFVALDEIKHSKEKGRKLAILDIVIGFIVIVLIILYNVNNLT